MASPLSILPHLAPYLSVAGFTPQYIPFQTQKKQEWLRKSGAPFGTPRVEALLESSLHHAAHSTGGHGWRLLLHDGAVCPCVRGDLANGLLKRPVDDPGTRPLVTVEGVEQVGDGLLCVQEHDATARHDALLEGRAGRRECVLHAMLLLLELRLGSSADLDDGHATGQLGETLLELLPVEVRVGGLDLGADLVDAARDTLGLTGTVDDGGVVLGDYHLPGTPQLVELGVLKLQA